MHGAMKKRERPGFSLLELLVVIAMIALIASAILFAMFGALEEAKGARTRAEITRLHEIIMERYAAYESRSLQIPAMAALSRLPDPREVARVRVLAMRDLMRLELPDRITDVADVGPNSAGPTELRMYYPNIYAANGTQFVNVRLAPPSLHLSYRKRATAATVSWSEAHQGAECLYLIVSSIHEEGGDPIDFFASSEIGDVDLDGMPEFLDGWGRPIGFFRWAPGFESPMQLANPETNPDPFDPLKTDVRWNPPRPQGPQPVKAGLLPGTYRLVPLIYSAGRDGLVDMVDQGSAFHYKQTPLLTALQTATTPPYCTLGAKVYPNDPYYFDTGSGYLMGQELDVNGDGILGYLDNITNHLIEVK